MPYLIENEELLRERNKRYVVRVFILRQLGTILCFLSFYSVISMLSYRIWAWLLLALNAFFWPILAFYLATNAKDSVKAEKYSLIIDTFLGGIWIALMELNPLPSLILVSIFIADRYAAGGWKLLRSSMLVLMSSLLCVWTLLGFPVNLSITPKIVWFTLPLATIYMIALSIVSRKLSMSLSKKNREIEKIAMIDPQLQIPNRRFFEQHLVSTFVKVQRGRCVAHLILLDVDNFKEVNDTYGHETGDYVLIEISNILKESIQVKDIPARYGGDELAIIAFNYDDQHVVNLAHQICQKVQRLSIPRDHQFKITISVGIAPAQGCGSTLQWLEHADKALYRVKREGRNGVNFCVDVA